MQRAEWTRDADSDLVEIVYDVSFKIRRPETAERIAREIRDKANLYASQPEMGSERPSWQQIMSSSQRPSWYEDG